MHSFCAGRRLAIILALLMLSLVTIGCRSEEPVVSPTATAPPADAPDAATEEQAPEPSETLPSGEAYPPLPAATATGGPYPPPTPTYIPTAPYPAEGAATEAAGILLTLQRPLQAGDTTVSGEGPAGITIFIRNITDMGVMLGQAVIGDDGTFSLEVPPLPADTRIGLTTADADLVEEGIRPGEGAISVPQVGYFYDSVMVRP